MLRTPTYPLPARSVQGEEVSPSKRATDPRIARVVKAVRFHLGDPLTISGIAAIVGLSRSRLEHLFSEETGLTFTETLREYRLAKALALLIDPTLRIKEIASLCGYSTIEGFDKAFRKRFESTPSGYRHSTFG